MPTDIVWFEHVTTRKDYEILNRHRSLCLWLTGLSGAGKSTLANAVQLRLHQAGVRAYLLDGDNVRHGLNGDLGFCAEDRTENVRRVAEVAKLFVDAGVVTITSLISPFEQDRAMARKIFNDGDFIEVFVDCPLPECIKRDPKGLYVKAQTGKIREFTGISSPYEVPTNPDLIINTAKSSVDDSVEQILQCLVSNLTLQEVRA